MSQYLQTSTSNPYGRRPWQTRLYTGFEEFGFLKQPQNTILREDFSIRPRIYRPPEMAGLGHMTIVGGSGKILRQYPRRARGLGLIASDGSALDIIFRRGLPPLAPVAAPVSQLRVVGPVVSAPPRMQILPPSLMPPVPSVVASGPGGTIYALPGDATAPGSPFAPPPAGQLFPTGSVPVSADAAASAASAAPPSALADWFNSSTWLSGVPNGYVAIGIAGAIFLFAKKKR